MMQQVLLHRRKVPHFWGENEICWLEIVMPSYAMVDICYVIDLWYDNYHATPLDKSGYFLVMQIFLSVPAVDPNIFYHVQ